MCCALEALWAPAMGSIWGRGAKPPAEVCQEIGLSKALAKGEEAKREERERKKFQHTDKRKVPSPSEAVSGPRKGAGGDE